MWRLLTLLGLSLVFISGLLSYQANTSDDYTLPEVLAAYEAGHFRLIPTSVDYHIISPDKQYLAVYGEGVYRLSDEQFWEMPNSGQFRFSPDGLYIAYDYFGVYRLSDWQEIVPVTAQSIQHSDHVFLTGEIQFSRDSAYASVEGQGVYRLSDGQQIIESQSLEMSFSPNSQYFDTALDGLYRLSDGQKLFNTYGHYPTFSPDSQYVYADLDGLYRIADGERLFDFGEGWISFSPDGQYAIADSVYRLSDGQMLYDIINGENLGISLDVEFSPDGQYFEAQSGVYHLVSGEQLFAAANDYAFSPDSQYLAVAGDGLYRLADRQKLFDIAGTFVRFSPNGDYLVALGDAVYELATGERIISIESDSFYSELSSPTFSADMNYLLLDNGSIYRISDAEEILNLDMNRADFSPDSLYLEAVTYDEGRVSYRLSDQKAYRGLSIVDVSTGILSLGNQILIIDESQEVLRLPFVFTRTHRSNHPLYSNPGFESEVISYSLPDRQYLFVFAEENGWYQINYRGEIGWLPAETVEYMELP